MRKFSKVALITAAALGIAGIGFSAGGAAMGASLSELDLQQYYDGPRLHFLERWLDWDWDDWDEEEHHEEESEHYASRSGTAVSAQTEGTDGEKYSLAVPSELDIELTYDELILREYEGGKVQVEVTGDEDGNVKVYTEDGELKIESRKKAKRRRIVVSCPPDTEFRKVGIDVDAGAVSVESPLSAGEFSVSVGAGVFSGVSSVTATDAEVEVGTGTLTMKNLDAENIDAECGLGTMELTVKGREEDYSYRLSCGAGSVELGEGEYSGVGAVKKIDNPNASRKMQLQCGMGTVKVSFEE
ncbi:MAG TPA: DUF4097 domain-containing protein [Candidatus Blautia faecipullorum]|nr:DUF4097 domain-containing protein [Candidatus Blautia faecipullorum]